jgi:hypothetical protein
LGGTDELDRAGGKTMGHSDERDCVEVGMRPTNGAWDEWPPLGHAPEPPDIEQTLEKLRNKDWADDSEWLELLGALFGSDEEVDEFSAWIHRRRRWYRM